ncbi:uncharacterized protein LOC106528984 isoform X3 [Austrofundulus limnaeus]|uniref:Uncharacterized protein LOC106528984 isoform X3 n=1 Tax=Austrofundulus limnaeus TaxID=52670 RepID=A0A2I4CIC6_AUSLI|nr:PREDICTED: uncharacterized protein LOC106528984 isoform X3 [Austrofundulus limnaeus]
MLARHDGRVAVCTGTRLRGRSEDHGFESSRGEESVKTKVSALDDTPFTLEWVDVSRRTERGKELPKAVSLYNFVSKKQRIQARSATASSLLGLVPAIICTRHLDTTEIVSMYAEDLPSPELVDQEVTRWKLKVPESQRPNTPASSLKECDRDMYPNLHVLLRLACTLPVTSCECERSASALRRLNNYMWASMGKERLSSLALLHIHYSKHVELDSVVDVFAKKHARRMELDCLLYPD